MAKGKTAISLALALWLCAAIAVGASGILGGARPPMPQVLIVILTIVSMSTVLTVSIFRQWADKAAVRALVAPHLTRFIGVYFLILAQRGTLSPRFAVPAGYGDILVAALALCLILIGPPTTKGPHGFYLAWNSLGLVDILLVVSNAARVGMSNPESMRALLGFPLNLLPTFLVPVIITSHLILFRRLCR